MTPPATLKRAVESYIETWGRRESHALIRRVILPRPLYRHDPGPDGGRSRFIPIGWRVFFKSKAGQIMALDAIRRKDRAYVFRFYVGEGAAQWLNRIRRIEKNRKAKARLLMIPGIHVSLIWLAPGGKKDDRFTPLDTDAFDGRIEWLARKELNESINAQMSSAAKMWKTARAITE